MRSLTAPASAPRSKGLRTNARLTTGHPTEEEQALYRMAMFYTAECRFRQGFYKEALDLYTSLVAIYHNRVDVLHALAGQRMCLWAMNNAPAARSILNDMQRAVNDLDDGAFDPTSSKWSRLQWERWLQKERDNDRKSLEIPSPTVFRLDPPGGAAPIRPDLGGR